MNCSTVLLLLVLGLATAVLAAKDPVCSLPIAIADENVRVCRAFIEAWAYNSETNECVYFINGGCGIGGNDNKFNSLAECEKKCKD